MKTVPVLLGMGTYDIRSSPTTTTRPYDMTSRRKGRWAIVPTPHNWYVFKFFYCNPMQLVTTETGPCDKEGFLLTSSTFFDAVRRGNPSRHVGHCFRCGKGVFPSSSHRTLFSTWQPRQRQVTICDERNRITREGHGKAKGRACLPLLSFFFLKFVLLIFSMLLQHPSCQTPRKRAPMLVLDVVACSRHHHPSTTPSSTTTVTNEGQRSGGTRMCHHAHPQLSLVCFFELRTGI